MKHSTTTHHNGHHNGLIQLMHPSPPPFPSIMDLNVAHFLLMHRLRWHRNNHLPITRRTRKRRSAIEDTFPVCLQYLLACGLVKEAPRFP
jgi:hypothetical protein